MCIFSGDGRAAATRIFAATRAGVASTAYAMTLTADSELAMILPVPVPAGARDDALAFVDLTTSPHLFDDLDAAVFPRPDMGRSRLGADVSSMGAIAVQTVGAYEASFVPRLVDFAGLDPRFQLSERVWRALPDYADYGFAVFRLRPGSGLDFHPMAFRFRTRFPERIFFPTVHVHDGEVHRSAHFDHTLFYQLPSDAAASESDPRSDGPLSRFLRKKDRRLRSLLDMDAPVYGREIVGVHANRDTFVDVAL